MVIANKAAIVHVRDNKMGFRKPIDYNSVHHQIYIAGVELYSPHNDGFVAWGIKQDLYKLKWTLDAIMKDAPTFVDEEEFVKEHEQKEMWRTLKQ